MKTKKFKLLSVVLSILIAFSAVSFLLLSKQGDTVYAAEVVITDWSQNDGALVGETLIVPQTVKLKVDENTEIDAESGLVIFPDGNAKSLEPKLLNMPGKYTLQYQATHNGKIVRGEKSFVVQESSYYLSSTTLSSAAFTKAEDLVMGGASVTKVYEGNTNPVLLNAADGIKVTLSKGDYFRYNKPINLFDVAAENDGLAQISLAYPMMDESILPGAPLAGAAGRWGKRLGSYFTIKLIDCYDESNYVEFFYWSNQWETPDGVRTRDTHVGVGSGEQQTGAIIPNNTASASVEINGTTYIKSLSNRYLEGKPGLIGRYMYSNTYALMNSNEKFTMFSYNPTTQEVFFSNSSETALINDLDNYQIYPNNPFKGFTTGEVYVQYEFQNSWTTSPMEVYIKSILGLKGDELKPSAVTDTTAPSVDIDVEYTDVENKSVYVSYNKEFELPKATVYDVNGNNEYELAVYYDYYTDNPKSVYLKDGKFTPNKKGVVYTAVYIAKDGFGNINLDAYGKCTDVINIIPVNGDAIEFTENTVASLDAAGVNYLPKIDVTTVNKGLVVKVNVIESNGNVIDITNSFDGDNYSFIPERLGEYTIKYIFEDNVNVEEYTYKVSSVDKNNVAFNGKMALPSIFIKDAVYDLEPYFASVATANGFEKRQADLLVSVDGGEFKKIENQRKFKVEGNSTLTFKAEYNGKQSATQTSIITDVNFTKDSSVNDGKRIYENYFVGFDSVIKETSYIEYGFDGTKDVDLKFASPLVFNAFSLEFEVPEECASNINTVSVVIKEISGQDKGYVVNFTSSGTGTYYVVKSLDGKETYLAKTVSDQPFAGEHSIVISDYLLEIAAGVASLPGMEAKNLEFSIKVENPTGEFSLRVGNVCGTAFRKNINEKSAQLVYDIPIGNAKVGVEYTLPTFNINSIWSPVSLADLKYSFVDDDGNVLVDINGKKVENISGDAEAITVIPDCVKTYNFEFSFSTLKLSDNKYFSLAVVDSNAPVVTFENGINSETVIEVKAGTMHKIKQFTVKDDVTPDESIIVRVCILDEYGTMLGWNVADRLSVLDGNGNIVGWEIDGEFGFAKEGTYRVVVFAQDLNKNSSMTYYKVLVKPAQ